MHLTKLKIKITTFMMAFIVMFGASESFAQQMSSYKIQSLFLYNFSKHVKWENEDKAFTIGVYGSSKALAEIKENLGSKQVWGKDIQIIEINSSADINKCHIAYLPTSAKKTIWNDINANSLSNTLLVSEDDMMSKGAAISFVYEQSKMKFKISKDRIEQAGMKVSSSLISIGIPV